VGRLGWLVVMVATAFVASSLAPSLAHGQERYRVTIAARVCPTYEAITANLRRNDIQESLQDLGPDSPYSGGQLIDPDVEAEGQPLCQPLTGWQFRMGRNYRTKAVSGPWGSLARVNDEFDTDIVTRESTPLLNSTGGSTGRSLAGAVTIELSSAELSSAADHDLWLQGGLPDDPVLYQTYPDQYGFGALRCAIDNLNGDNVEYVAFPEGASHVYCFAYYVSPPPTAGTIVVRKEVDPAGDPDRHAFQFGGDLSYNPGGAFSITAAPGDARSETFVRGAGTPWTVREVPEPGWALQGLGCTSQLGSTIARPALEPEVTVTLVPGDIVTCTYRNALAPPPSGLALGKVTTGAIGVTDFRVVGEPGVFEAPVTTTEPGNAEYLVQSQLPAGDYRVSETPSDMEGGRWRGRELRCGGRIIEPFESELTLTVPPGAGIFCVWENEFVHAGSIRVRKIMVGDTGDTGFTIRRVDADPDSETVYQQHADVRREGVPFTAEGDSTDGIPIGTYEIQETTPSGRGSWRLESVTCDGEPVGSAQGRVRIRLTDDRPGVTCTFTDRFSRTPPGGGGAAGSDPSPQTNLRITKRVSPTTIVAGQPVRYTVVVRNVGRVTARDVVVAELRPPSHRAVDIEAPRGVRCRGTRPLRCVIGVMRPGRRMVFRATYTTPLRGRVVNRVAVHTSTAETRLSDNRARAALRVVSPRPGVCAAGARAAC